MVSGACMRVFKSQITEECSIAISLISNAGLRGTRTSETSGSTLTTLDGGWFMLQELAKGNGDTSEIVILLLRRSPSLAHALGHLTDAIATRRDSTPQGYNLH
jgi:hypothetical protein